MKNAIVAIFAAMAATAVFAAADDVLITFSTPGPDTYADGTKVLEGETYALCWSTNDFKGFKINPDGRSAEGGVVVLRAPVATKDSNCPKIVFEVSSKSDFVKQEGKWAVYLLDTRRFDENGKVSSVGGAVNTYGLVGDSVAVGTKESGTLAGKSGATSEIASAAVAASKPEIKGIKLVDGYVYVTVKGAPYLGYGLVAGETPNTVTADVEGATAAPTGEEEVTIVTEAKAGGEFFKATRK